MKSDTRNSAFTFNRCIVASRVIYHDWNLDETVARKEILSALINKQRFSMQIEPFFSDSSSSPWDCQLTLVQSQQTIVNDNSSIGSKRQRFESISSTQHNRLLTNRDNLAIINSRRTAATVQIYRLFDTVIGEKLCEFVHISPDFVFWIPIWIPFQLL